VSRIAPKPGSYPVPHSDVRDDIVSHTLRRVTDSPLDRAIVDARDALAARQHAEGYWLFELEADCTIPSEYIMMMHFLDEIDVGLEAKLCNYLRSSQAEHGGWPLYHGGDFNISCSVKAYYALKLAGDSPDAPHMVRARAAILHRGGAARVNVFTRIALALFDLLRRRHKLNQRARDVLALSALVHDVGRSVDDRTHPRQGARLLLKDRDLPLGDTLRRRLAYLTLYHRGPVPLAGEDGLLLAGEDANSVRVLLGLLRAADALDSRRAEPPTLRFTHTGRRLRVDCHLRSGSAKARKIYTRRKKFRLLEETLGCKVDLRVRAGEELLLVG